MLPRSEREIFGATEQKKRFDADSVRRIPRSAQAGNNCRTRDFPCRKPAKSLHNPPESLSKVNLSAGVVCRLPCEITAGDIGGCALQFWHGRAQRVS
jgi:hypothetical protein